MTAGHIKIAAHNTPEQKAYIAMHNSLADAGRFSEPRFAAGAVVLMVHAWSDGKDEERYDRGCPASTLARQSMVDCYSLAVRHGFIDC